jgi:hypothetical protein
LGGNAQGLSWTQNETFVSKRNPFFRKFLKETIIEKSVDHLFTFIRRSFSSIITYFKE